MSNPINPWEQPEHLTYHDFLETMGDAFKDWLDKNPRELPGDMPWVYAQLLRKLIQTNAEQIDAHLRREG